MNVPTNVPSVHCVPRSRMKLRSIRGPSWFAASVRATRITENTTPITVMIAAASAARICREASAVPLITQDGSLTDPLYAARSSRYRPQNSRNAAPTSSVGTHHKLVRSASRRQPGRSSTCVKAAVSSLSRSERRFRPFSSCGSPRVRIPTP